ncbi:hypothetical protein P152DRAFT_448816 [Eremomyces bilateralis CBS 781.70]|uniref:Bacteriophage T5 Orf172 DNA-binding domain-containing protein n=1 Tax=Eremomyces bilateralis CBS 781.70 TaxID=1392243 RepID=A0A6G1G6G3_9PEZI|nr:uncharacterized protein P152DRAFT_448816 [Eremomyces bilateralis CBS 781.70]KAF1813516.1 hypothetical protein P152DRAFT_448816 [Eremomyces bilateralis CBS 781.70]
MPPALTAPELHQIGPNRTDSRNASRTCHGITQKGRPCRRALAAPKSPLAVTVSGSDEGSVDLQVDAEALYCVHHKTQAVRDKHVVTVRRVGSKGSLEELFSGLGIAESEIGTASGRVAASPSSRGRNEHVAGQSSTANSNQRKPRRARRREEGGDPEWVPESGEELHLKPQGMSSSYAKAQPPRTRARAPRRQPRKKASFLSSLMSCMTLDEPLDDSPRAQRRPRRKNSRESPLAAISEEQEPAVRASRTHVERLHDEGPLQQGTTGELYPRLPERLSTDTLVASMRLSAAENESRRASTPRHGQQPKAESPSKLRTPSTGNGPTTPKRRPVQGITARKDSAVDASDRSDSPMQANSRSPQRTTAELMQTISHLPPALAASLLAKLATFKPTGTDGYIYIYWLTDAHDLPLPQPYHQNAMSQNHPSTLIPSLQRVDKPTIFLKIGLATNVYRRMKQWDDCGYPKYNWFYPRASSGSTPVTTPDGHHRRHGSTAAAASHGHDLNELLESEPDRNRVIRSVDWVEKMIHLELQEQRVKWECTRHERWHTEWFEVERSRRGITRVFEVVKKWAEQSEKMMDG